MNKPIKNVFFWSLLIFYVFGLLMTYAAISFPKIIRNYYADLVALPIMLSIILTILRHLKSEKNLVLSKYKVFVAFIYLSVVFEFILPYFSLRYTRDYYDVVAYAIGASIFYFYQKLYLSHETKSID